MKKKMIMLLLILSAGVFPVASQEEANESASGRISRPGEYRGYSSEIYDGWIRHSRHITVRDGTRIALDYYLPALDGQPASEPLPVIWTHHRYQRARLINGAHHGRYV